MSRIMSEDEVRTLDEVFLDGGNERMRPDRVLNELREKLGVDDGDKEEELLSECERKWVSFAAILGTPSRMGMTVLFGRSGSAKTVIAEWALTTTAGATPKTRRPGRTTQAMFSAYDGKRAAVVDDAQVGRGSTVRDIIRALASREEAGSRQYGINNPPVYTMATVQTDDVEARMKVWTRDLSNVTYPVLLSDLPRIPGRVASMFVELARRPPAQRPNWDRIDTHPDDKWFSLAETAWRLTADALGDEAVVKVEPATSIKPEGVRPMATSYKRTRRLPVTPVMICSNPEVPRVTAERVSELAKVVYGSLERYMSTETAAGALNVRAYVYFTNEFWVQLATCSEFEKGGDRAVKEVFRGMKQLQLRGTMVHRRLRDLKTELREFAEAVLGELEKIKF